MRQTDGTDLLGANNPRSSDMGVIYVSPEDDRQSVLAAILTQDKLGRREIVVVLPESNKAFRRAVDFDGLKSMRRGLQAQLVFISPSGSSPAEFARQRRFPVYPSLESYVQALREEDQTQGAAGWGRVFGRRQKAAGREVAPSPSPVPGENEQPQPPSSAPAAPSMEQQVEASAQPEPAWTDEDDRVIEFPVVPPGAPEDEVTQPGNAPLHGDSESTAVGGPTGSEEGDEEEIIRIPPAPGIRAGAPGNLPAPLAPVGAPAPAPAPPAARASGFPATYAPRRRRWRWLISIPLLLLLVVLGFLVYRPLLDLIIVPSATVTITPVSKDVKNTYSITAVTGGPDAAKREVQARVLYAASKEQAKTASATGEGQTPGKQAAGFLTFYNSSTAEQTISAGTVLTDANGIQIVSDADAVIPPETPPVEGQTTVAAHAVQAGASGNIPANDFNYVPCCTAGVFVQNALAFSGGQDPQRFTYVEQSDIDNAASALTASLVPATEAALQKQLRPGEQPVSSPQCVPFVSSDANAGTQVATLTVRVTVICTGEVYDQQEASLLAMNLLKTDPARNPGRDFVLVGDIVTKVMQARADVRGTITLQVSAEGIWVYQFNESEKQALAKLIAGKSEQDAESLLRRQVGVAKTSIQLVGGDGNTLPANSHQIVLAVLGVPGLRAQTPR